MRQVQMATKKTGNRKNSSQLNLSHDIGVSKSQKAAGKRVWDKLKAKEEKIKAFK